MSEFQKIWKIYEESFPKSERRNLALQKEVLKNPRYHLRPLYEGKLLIGFLATWGLNEFIFIEHYAIDKKYRAQGYGKKFLRNFLKSTDKSIILEVEKPETMIAKKRILFYKKLHFHCNPFDYVQPPYEENQEPVPLLLMTYPDPISQDAFKNIKNKLYQEVYGRG